MTDHLHQLEALCRDPRLQVQPEQRAKIVENIIHSTMHPYFLKKSPEEQEQFRPHYLHHMQMLADYCLREYIETPEPRLTIEVVKGLHRVLYHNSATVPVKAMDGSMISMVPGEFKASAVGISRLGRLNEFLATTAPEYVRQDMEMLLDLLHDEQTPIFQRYFRFMLDFTEIHPFADSNGKLSLLLDDLFLLKQGIQPPYFSGYKWENEREFYELAERYSLDSQRDISIFYPLAVRAYASCNLVASCNLETIPAPVPEPSLPDRVFAKLLEETALSIETGDLPVGAVLTVGDTLLASNHNTIRSDKGRRFHAERNLLSSLEGGAIPAGRRVLWVTLEPCMRCAQAIQRFGVDEVVYVLDDPFGGGKSLLAKGGSVVSRRPEWEKETLRLVMDFHARYPEFCAVRQYRFYLDAWQRHSPLAHDEQVRAVFLHHLAPYLPNVREAEQNEARCLLLGGVLRHFFGANADMDVVDISANGG